MKWIGTRISYLDQDNKTTFVIQPENPGIAKALIGAWFCMWVVIGAFIFWALFSGFAFQTAKGVAPKPEDKQQAQIILIIFLVFWFYYFQRVGRSFAWLMAGKEMIKVDKIALTIKNSIKGYGKAKEFYLENISKIRVSVPKANSFQSAWENSPWIRGGERLEFEYLGKTVRFGRKLNEQESKLLFQVVTKRIEDQLRSKKRSGE
jgi:hypothetical protein